MVHNSVSSKQVIGDLIRNIRLTDASYVNDLTEWIGEGLQIAFTNYETVPAYEELIVKNHKARLPCGIAYIKAVEYRGSRLRRGSSEAQIGKVPKNLTTLNTAVSATYTLEMEQTILNLESNRISGQDLIPFPENQELTAYYFLVLDYIQTSFCDGCIKLHYAKYPVDDEGYPMIPDNANYKRGLFWHLMSCIVMAGYEPINKEFTYSYCLNMFETYSIRGINEIKYWDIDQAEKTKEATVRLVLPYSYYTDFSTGYEQIQQNRGL